MSKSVILSNKFSVSCDYSIKQQKGLIYFSTGINELDIAILYEIHATMFLLINYKDKKNRLQLASSMILSNIAVDQNRTLELLS